MHDWKSSDEVDKDMEIADPSVSSLDSYSGCADYLLRACGAISTLASCIEKDEIKCLGDILAMVDTM